MLLYSSKSILFLSISGKISIHLSIDIKTATPKEDSVKKSLVPIVLQTFNFVCYNNGEFRIMEINSFKWCLLA
jgi:hypothetical protein